MNPNVETLIAFIHAQMDGEQPPPLGSAAFNQLTAAFGAFQKSASDDDLRTLAHRTLGTIIDRMCSNIEAQKALRAFIQPGDME